MFSYSYSYSYKIIAKLIYRNIYTINYVKQESDILIADYSFDQCSFIKDDEDDMCAYKYPDA